MNKAIFVVRYESEPYTFKKKIIEISKYLKVYVYDNSILPLTLSDNNVHYYHDSSNNGLARAINYCVDLAVDDGIDIVTYFDQDSSVSVDIIKNLQSSYANLEQKHSNIFALGPQPITTDGDNYPVRLCNKIDGDYFSTKEIITSGMTFRLKNIKYIGYFDEDLFLDMVDFDICWRAIENNMLIVVDTSIKMVHEVGVNTIKLPFKLLPISSPVRNYYQMRNMLYCAIYKNKKNKPTVIYYIFRRMVNVFINIVFTDKKYLRLKFNVLGVKDAINKKMGKFEK
jgi:rhamnosyltransferase